MEEVSCRVRFQRFLVYPDFPVELVKKSVFCVDKSKGAALESISATCCSLLSIFFREVLDSIYLVFDNIASILSVGVL
jgi:hypothetical protein